MEPASQEIELTALSAKIDEALTLERVALANLQFRGAQIFGFQGAPLIQLGYVDQTTGPVLFCIIRNSEADAGMRAERRGGFSSLLGACWARLHVDRKVAGQSDDRTRRFASETILSRVWWVDFGSNKSPRRDDGLHLPARSYPRSGWVLTVLRTALETAGVHSSRRTVAARA